MTSATRKSRLLFSFGFSFFSYAYTPFSRRLASKKGHRARSRTTRINKRFGVLRNGLVLIARFFFFLFTSDVVKSLFVRLHQNSVRIFKSSHGDPETFEWVNKGTRVGTFYSTVNVSGFADVFVEVYFFYVYTRILY